MKRVNLALRPSLEAEQLAIACSREIAERWPTQFTLYRHGPFPHITQYSFERKVGISRIRRTIWDEVRVKGSELRAVMQSAEHHSGYVGVDLERNVRLHDFHYTILRALRSFAVTGGEHADLENLTEMQVENVREYGYPDAGPLYNPHMTFTRLKQPEHGEQVVQFLNERWRDFPSFYFANMGLFKAGPNGTCVELIENYPLSTGEF